MVVVSGDDATPSPGKRLRSGQNNVDRDGKIKTLETELAKVQAEFDQLQNKRENGPCKRPACKKAQTDTTCRKCPTASQMTKFNRLAAVEHARTHTHTHTHTHTPTRTPTYPHTLTHSH